MANTIAQALIDYFNQCPALNGGKISPEYLPAYARRQGAEWAISMPAARVTVNAFMDGDEERVLPFTIDMVRQISQDDARMIAGLGVSEAIESWLDEQQPGRGRPSTLPELPNGNIADRVVAIGPTFVQQLLSETVQFSTQFELHYLKTKKE